VEVGVIWKYWEPFLLIDTASVANYSPMLGGGDSSTGSIVDQLGGKNNSSNSAEVNESTFFQAHGFLLPLMFWQPCDRYDYGAYWSEFDAMWQNDELAAIITPEATMYANLAMQMSCQADAAATNLGAPIDAMPWCVGSSGSAYPMTGHVDNDNIIQASNTAAARLIYKLCRMMMICDPAYSYCYGSCAYTPVWIKSHYRMYPVRPSQRMTAFPMGVTATMYGPGLNPPYKGELGSNDEFLWVVHRLHRCCSCCQSSGW
jgi:conjugal transfer pilus assembly protein TraU